VITPIARVFDEAALARVRLLLDAARFDPGGRTAGWHARLVKDNAQAAADDPRVAEAAGLVAAALRAHPVFQAAVLPRRLRPVTFARYRAGQAYGPHVDDAVMGLEDAAGPLRTDLAVTVFLAPRADYQGGALVLDTPGGELAWTLEAGDALAYPATTLHHVAPVTAGERLVALTWVQSLVRDPAAREILFDLDAARRAVFEREGKSPTFDRIAKSHANLLRRWAEP